MRCELSGPAELRVRSGTGGANRAKRTPERGRSRGDAGAWVVEVESKQPALESTEPFERTATAVHHGFGRQPLGRVGEVDRHFGWPRHQRQPAGMAAGIDDLPASNCRAPRLASSRGHPDGRHR